MKQYTGLRLNDNHPIQDGNALDERTFQGYVDSTTHQEGPQPDDLQVGQSCIRTFPTIGGTILRVELRRLPDKEQP